MQRNSKGQTAVYNLLSHVKDILKTSSKMKHLLFWGFVLSAFKISHSNIPDFCLLPPDVGQGTSFTFAVHYDVNKDQCTPFLYNGQGGNANRFENERECMRNCSPNAENIYPMDASKGCTLEKAEGECNGKYLRYYYDSTDKKCKKFLWTGCLGNGNRFFDYNSCNSTCSVVQDKCHLTPDEGHGSSFNFAVYYDSTKDQCSPFIYKGEGGNANRFENEAECMRNCSPNAENIYPMDASKACLLKRTEGGCNGNCVKYYYDSRDEKCKEFIWTGCFGNGNRFHDYNSCNSTCSGVKDKCYLPPDEGRGSSFNFAVYYDSTKDQCSPFIYKGEGGNDNRFENEAECMRNCSPNAENIYPMDASKACLLKRAEGGCNGNCVKYYYDSSDKKCKEFIWTGCSGNGNRFHDYNSCNSTCSGVIDGLEEDEVDTPTGPYSTG
ncbi:papilin-like isoform X1 [Oreochromis aureus]|uniref:papilin-like isoform X1 n=1 Tax=Oreochromis aureus TaxID=47969 RepID=UPI001953323F|nr:papilin-like isoform X1 [Oreochromis aureus]